MGFLTNIWTRYTDRTASQVKDNVLTNMQAQVPEITDHSESNLFVKLVNIFSGIMELIHYYIDNAAREAQLDGARIYRNVVKLSRSWGYRISASQPANVLLTISYTSTTTTVWTGTTIPLGSIVQTTNGIQFITTDELIIPAGSFSVASGQVSAKNTVFVSYFTLVVSDGSPSQVHTVVDKVSGLSLLVRTGANVWTSVETLAFSEPTDFHFIQTINEDKEVVLQFGDDVNGLIPPIGVDIEIQYDQTEGINGNVAGQTIVQIVSGFPVVPSYVASVTNQEPAVGGVDVESINSIKQNVARLVRTVNKAVTELDFKDIAILHPQVENAGILFDCGKTVEVYVVPIGGGIAPPSLLSSVTAWFEDNRRIITHTVVVLSAGEIHILGRVDVIAQAGFDQAIVLTNVENAWLEYFSSENQEISGAVRIGDIYEAIEAAEGVQTSEITLLNAEPFARNIAPTTNVLDFDIVTNPASQVNVVWQIQITSPTQFQLLKDGNFVATFTIGIEVVQTEITFTVNASSYSIGDKWQFTSYPFGGNTILLDEPSIPTSDLTDVQINITG